MEAEIKIKSDNYIQLNNNRDILRLGIRDSEGKDTGNFLEFNLKATNLLLIYQKLIDEDKKNRAYLNNQFNIIDKKQDHKGKKLLSSNEEAKLKALNEFYKKEEVVYDMFLGEGGVKKLLNGRELTWTTFAEIDEIIEKSILPHLELKAEDIKKDIMSKYSVKRDDVIE